MQQEVNWKTFRAQFDASTKAEQAHMIAQQLPNFTERPGWVSADIWKDALKQLTQKKAA